MSFSNSFALPDKYNFQQNVSTYLLNVQMHNFTLVMIIDYCIYL